MRKCLKPNHPPTQRPPCSKIQIPEPGPTHGSHQLLLNTGIGAALATTSTHNLKHEKILNLKRQPLKSLNKIMFPEGLGLRSWDLGPFAKVLSMWVECIIRKRRDSTSNFFRCRYYTGSNFPKNASVPGLGYRSTVYAQKPKSYP